MRKPDLSNFPDFLSLYSRSTLILITIMFVFGILRMIFPELIPVSSAAL